MEIRSIVNPEVVLGIVFGKASLKPGLDFLTGISEPIQVATFRYDKGKELKAHRHIERKREVIRTQEVLIVLSGRVLLDVYDSDDHINCFVELFSGDGFISLNGGVGYKVLAHDTQMIEVKVGPYEVNSDEEDRVRL